MNTVVEKRKLTLPGINRIKPDRFPHQAFSTQRQQKQIRKFLRANRIQADLGIGKPNDKYELEADRVADQVMRMSSTDVSQQLVSGSVHSLQIQHLIQANKENVAQRNIVEEDDILLDEFSPNTDHKLESEGILEQPLRSPDNPEFHKALDKKKYKPKDEEEKIQTKLEPGKNPLVTHIIKSKFDSLKNGGQPLDDATRSFFEPRFGRDFSNVRIHTDRKAADTARSIHARAFTQGSHVVMGAGEYKPTTQSGLRLLGHELTHTVQQRESVQSQASGLQCSNGIIQREALDAAAGLIRNIVSDPFSVSDPVEMIFDSVVASNRAISSRITIPSNWITLLTDFAKAHPDDGAILIHALSRLPAFYRGGWIMDLQSNAAAMTLDHSIFTPAGSTLELDTFVHELVHVSQYGLVGVTPFLVSYFGMSGATIVYRWTNGQPVNSMRSSPHEDQAYNLESRFLSWLNNR